MMEWQEYHAIHSTFPILSSKRETPSGTRRMLCSLSPKLRATGAPLLRPSWARPQELKIQRLEMWVAAFGSRWCKQWATKTSNFCRNSRIGSPQVRHYGYPRSWFSTAGLGDWMATRCTQFRTPPFDLIYPQLTKRAVAKSTGI